MSGRLDALLADSFRDGLLKRPSERPFCPGVAGHANRFGAFVDAGHEVFRQPQEDGFQVHSAMLAPLLSASTTDSVIGMSDNGRRIGPSSLATCKRCGCPGLAWTQNKAGRWYLCGTFRAQSERELYVMATWAPHRCEDYRARLAEVQAAQERADRDAADAEADRAHAAAIIRRGLPKLRAALQAEADPDKRAGLETLLADLEAETS